MHRLFVAVPIDDCDGSTRAVFTSLLFPRRQEAHSVRLMASFLRPDGAQYQTLSEVLL